MTARKPQHRRHILVSRRGRAAPVHWEWHTHGGVYSLSFGISNPRAHRWWATTVYLYLPGWAGRLLSWVPSTGHRAWRDSWSPLNPWAGPFPPWRPRTSARRAHESADRCAAKAAV